MQTDLTSRCWAEINLDGIVNNYLAAEALAKPAAVYAVVKANAYGHGALPVARALAGAGANRFATACIEEALELRSGGIAGEILVLGHTPPEYAALLAGQNITCTLHSPFVAVALSAAATAAGVTVQAHIKADTGMARIGYVANSLACEDEIAAACRLPGLKVTGLFTHFAVADETGDIEKAYTNTQFAGFTALVARLAANGVAFKTVHCCNSGALCQYPNMHLNAVRPGICLYGSNPGAGVLLPNCKPTLTLKARVVQVKTIAQGSHISYGCTFTAAAPLCVATLSAGYADGYPRALSNKGVCSINGLPAPVVGRVCMDQMMVDLTACGTVAVGDEAVLFGAEAADSIDTAAEKAGTIPHVIMCGLGPRANRVYR